MAKRYSLLSFLYFIILLPAVAQKIREPDWDPDTVRVLYLDDCCERPHPPSTRFPYHGAAVRTLTDAAGNYEGQMHEAESRRLLFTVRHLPSAGLAELTMYYPNGKPRLQANFKEDTSSAWPVVYYVPSLRRPLSAYATLDGEFQTFYESGNLRQEAVYQAGRRLRSKCYDFRGRPVNCNANPPIIGPRLPAVVERGKSFSYAAAIEDDWPPPKTLHQLDCKATFIRGQAGEPLVLRLLLPRKGISAESAALAAAGGRYPISFGLAANAQGSRGTGSHSGALNQELRFIGINMGRLFSYNPKQPLKPTLVDGEPVGTYFTLPVEFGLLK